MWLEEAIRETVLSELACAEFPHGAVPVVAIIDTGNHIYWDDGSTGARRAILVRPNFLRLAHLERSIYFGTAGKADSPQYLDAQRTREAILAFCALSEQQTDVIVRVNNLEESFKRIAEQIGFGWVHRVSHGAFSSANISVNAELVDFGNFRALPDWRKALTVEHAPGFGDELHIVDRSVNALAFYFLRHAPPAPRARDKFAIQQMLRRVAMQRFDAEIGRILGPLQNIDSRLGDELAAALRNLFFEQQSHLVDYFKGEQKRSRGWLYGTLRLPEWTADSAALSAANTIARRVASASGCSRLPPSASVSVIAGILRWSQPRRLLYRENLLRSIMRLMANKSCEREDFAGRLETFIAALLSRGRRVWNSMDTSHILSGQVTDLLSSALYCQSPDGGSRYLRVEATVRDQRALCFGAELALRDVAARHRIVSCSEERVVFDIPHEWINLHRAAVVQLVGRDVHIPRPAATYASRVT